MEPPMVADGSRASYDRWHERLDVDAAIDTPWHTLARRYLDPARDLADRRVLEIGCGRGGFACWLATQPFAPAELIAADFSASAVQKGREHASARGIDAIRWETNDIQSIAHAERSFDTVISCETIEHVPDPVRAVRELARVLKPGGRLFLTTPNYLGTMGLYRIYLRLRGRVYTEVGQPINQFLLLPRTRGWVADAGLSIEAVDAAGHYLPLPGGLRAAEWMRRPHALMKWFGHHSIVVGLKRESRSPVGRRNGTT